MAIQIRLTHLSETRIAQSARDEDDGLMEQIAKALADEIHRRIKANLSSDWACFPEEADTIDDLAMKFSDVWIIGVADHAENYSVTFAAPNLADSPDIPQEDIIQKSKGFSGDVSGVIGETLFTVVVKRCFSLDENRFAHLRAHKGTGEQPDFAVFFPTDTFLGKFEEFALYSDVRPIPCEVKAISTAKLPIPSDIRDRIRKAMSQLQNYWRIRDLLDDGSGMGVICVAIRNPGRSYDVSFIWCK